MLTKLAYFIKSGGKSIKKLENSNKAINGVGIAEEKLGKVMSIRTEPSIIGTTVGTISPHSRFDFIEYVRDTKYPLDDAYQWLKLSDNEYTNYIYPPNGLRVNILQEPNEESPEEDAWPPYVYLEDDKGNRAKYNKDSIS